MKKIYLLGFLSMLALTVSATTKHYTQAEMQNRVKEGLARELPAKALKTKGAVQQALPVRTDQQKSTVKNLALNPAPQFGFAKKAQKNISTYSMSDAGGDVYGYLSYEYNMEKDPGMYELTPTGYNLKWVDPLYEAAGLQASNGWLVDGKIQGVVTETFWGFLNGYYSFTIDFETGELEAAEDLDLQATDIFFLVPAYNSEDGLVYGYAYNWADDAEIYWAVADPENILEAEAVKYAGEDLCYSLCYNSTEGCFYGVNVQQQFVRIDLDGTQTVVATVPNADFMATYVTGLVWNPVTGLYYWNYNDEDDEAGLYSITPDGTFDLLVNYPSGEEFTYFVTTDVVVDPTVPTRPVYLANSFEGNSMQGTVTFTLPETFGDGSPLPFLLDYTATLDDEVYLTGQGTRGSDVSVGYVVKEPGWHTFGLYVTALGNNSSTTKIKLYIGNDTPMAPANVQLTDTEVTWNAVTEGVNGGYLDLSAMYYIVSINGKEVGTTTGTKLSVTLPSTEPLAQYVASVVAVCNEFTSAPGYSNSLVAGAPLQVPVYLQPTQEEFGLMTVLDRNADDNTWYYNTDYEAAATTYGLYEPMDDYLFLPPVSLTSTDKYYSFSMESAIRSTSWNEEYLTVYYATAPNPSAIKGTLVETFTPDHVTADPDWTYSEALWQVETPGVYYIVLHCTSEVDQYGVMARNFRIETTNITTESPVAPLNLKAVAAEGGVLEAAVSFTFPSQTLAGTAIEAGTAMTATISLNTTDATYTVEGKAGETGNVTVTTVQGNNTVYAQVKCGDLESPKASTTVYTGISVPATPTGGYAEVAPDMLSAVLHWNPVTTPYVEGTYIDPETVTYEVYVYRDYGFYATWVLLESGITSTSYTFNVEKGSVQEIYNLGVVATNEAGSNGYLNVIQNVYMGSAYELPLVTVINEEVGPTPEPWYIYNAINGVQYTGGWMLDYISFYLDEYTEDAPALLAYASGGVPCQAAVGVPRFSTMNCKEVKLEIEHGAGPIMTSYNVYGQVNGSTDFILAGSYEGFQGETNVLTTSVFTLPDELRGQPWVQLYVIPEFTSYLDVFVMTKLNVTSDTSTDAIATLLPGNSISAEKGAVVVKGFEGKDITISTLTGAKIAGGKVVSDYARYNAAPGVYVVKAGDVTAKVIVK
ncbi:MAG: hypothetical protein J1F20_07760 [Muribaculaceae bacterium]|nr:hypothetical protein [Muribaculaceae bacterium]